MKEINVNGITYLNSIEGTDKWYYGIDYLSGDLYEAEEIFQLGHEVKGSNLYLVKYPEGETFQPVERTPNCSLGVPVYHENKISFPEVDFVKGEIHVYSFDCNSHDVSICATVPLKEVEDCYNLRVYVWPLMLCRHDNKGNFDIVWPVKKRILTTVREALCYRDNDHLVFSRWEEDPDYREETVVRDFETGEILEVFPGNVMLMPDGSQWHVH